MITCNLKHQSHRSRIGCRQEGDTVNISYISLLFFFFFLLFIEQILNLNGYINNSGVKKRLFILTCCIFVVLSLQFFTKDWRRPSPAGFGEVFLLTQVQNTRARFPNVQRLFLFTAQSVVVLFPFLGLDGKNLMNRLMRPHPLALMSQYQINK